MSAWLERPAELIAVALAGLTAQLVAALLGLVLWRAIDELRFLRRQRLIARYRPFVDVLLRPTPAPDAVRRLARTPRRHRLVLADLILSVVRLTSGDIVQRLRGAAAALGLIDQWTRSLGDRRWWVRAGAARALGLVREPSSIDALLEALDDPHEEVRAAAADALGRLGDPRSCSALLARVSDESRHQRARLVEAIRALGPSVVPLLLAHARERASDTAMVVDVLGIVGGTAAMESLLEWTGAAQPSVRAAAFRALGAVGLDDRSFYYALRGLEDPDPNVRGLAARALGRSGMKAAVPYLLAHLDDEWIVAAHSATGLRRLGRAGAAALEERAASAGRGADFARQMLWEIAFLKAGG